MVVIGSGPGGQRAAIQAAKLGKRVAVVERKRDVGGVCIATGTIPSKTLRETILHLSGFRERGIYGASYMVKPNIAMSDLVFRVDRVIRHEDRRGPPPAAAQQGGADHRLGRVHRAAQGAADL